MLIFAIGGIATLIIGPLGIFVVPAAAAIGLTLVWTLRRWERREQRVATLTVGAAPFAALALVGVLVQTFDTDGAAVSLIFAISVGLTFEKSRRRSTWPWS